MKTFLQQQLSMGKRLVTVLFLLTFVSLQLFSQKRWTIETVPNPKAVPNWNYVSNPDNILSTSTVDQINSQLKVLEQQRTEQAAVVVLQSIGDKNPKQFATGLLREWGVGQKGKNNGFLILVVIDQRRMEFEIGYGLEGVLTDVTCKQIQQQYMVPYAKQGDFNTAVLNGVMKVCEMLQADNGEAVPVLPNETDTYAEPSPIPYAAPQPNEAYNQDPPPSTSFFEQLSNKFPLMVVAGVLLVFYLAVATVVRKKDAGFIKKSASRNATLVKLGVALLYVFLFSLVVKRLSFLNLVIGFYIWVCLNGLVAVFFEKYRLKKSIEGKDRETVYRLVREAYLKWSVVLKYIIPLPYNWYFNSLKKTMEKLRAEPVFNEHNGREMYLLDEQADDAYLAKYQVKEEELGAVDYDVWRDNQGNEQKIFRYELFSKYKACPKCHAVTFSLTGNKTLYPASYSSSGTGLRTYTCAFCKFKKEEKYIIPKKEHSSSSGSGSGSSSSGSSSGGSSYGGGSSGGGGAGSSW